MSDDNKKADAKVKFAIDTMRPSIKAASDAAHEIEIADDDLDFEFDMELAWVVKRLPALRPHNLRVLNHIIDELLAIEEHGLAHEPQQASH
jgi:hypothetical protein